MAAPRMAHSVRPSQAPPRGDSRDARRASNHATAQGLAVGVVRPPAAETLTEAPTSPRRDRGQRKKRSAPVPRAGSRPAPQAGGILLAERHGRTGTRNPSLP